MIKECKITVLCENSVAGPFGLTGEHGWAAYVEADGLKILFDTGQGQGIIGNSLILGTDLREIDSIVLSHGHYDHTSGLPGVVQLRGPVPVFAHPDIFLERYWSRGQVRRHIGIRFTRAWLEALGCKFEFRSGFSEIYPGVFITGQVPRVTDFEPPDPDMKVPGDDGKHMVQDQLRDDLSMVVDTASGLFVILGCAHAGLVNILKWCSENLPGRPFHTVIGGTHLGFAKKEQFDKTLAALDEFEIKRLGASHCTGLENSSRLFCALGDRFFHASVGTVIGSND
ncbi:MAG: MBL fold metallo-hydrolase [Thermodesulfatator sp.]|nr:MAG: MBL fold metallo-hydrolase [Thermodesulfatator sp.]